MTVPSLMDLLLNHFDDEVNEDKPEKKRTDVSKLPTSEFIKCAQAYLNDNLIAHISYTEADSPAIKLQNNVVFTLNESEGTEPSSIEAKDALSITPDLNAKKKGRR